MFRYTNSLCRTGVHVFIKFITDLGAVDGGSGRWTQSRLYNITLAPPPILTPVLHLNLHLNQLILPKMHANSISMSVRTAMLLGPLNPAAPSLVGALRPIQQTTSRTASKQLTRLSSTTARPLSSVTLNSDSRPQAKAVSSSTAGLRSQSTAAPANGEAKLDWNTFFKLRASRRRYSLASSIATSIVSTTAGVQVLSGQDLEALGGAVMGLDPFVVLGLATAACGAAGWLVGPIVGNGVWGLVYRKFKPSVNTVSFPDPRMGLFGST